jgi:CBS domain-containing protein
MAAMFAGASHAVLASVVFAFETTRQPVGLLPLLVGCTAAFLVSLLLNRHSIMTEKLARRGISVRTEYSLDYLSRVRAADVGEREVVTLCGNSTVSEAIAWLDTGDAAASHQGFPIVDDDDLLIGVLTRRDIVAARDEPRRRLSKLIRRPPVVVFEHHTLRDAADQMVIEHVGRVPIVRRDDPRRVIGILSRSDLLTAHAPRLKEAREFGHVRTILRARGSG